VIFILVYIVIGGGMGEFRNAKRILVTKPEGKRNDMEDLGVGGRG
jgi:hypothetical protein